MNKILKTVALFITIYFPPEPGGGSSGAWTRASVLERLGYSVFVLSSFPSYPTGRVADPKYKRKFFYVERVDPFTIIRIRNLPLPHTGYLNRLALFVVFLILTIICFPRVLKKTGKVGMVYAESPILFSSVIGWVYSKICRAYYIYEAVDLWPEELVTVKSHVTPLLISIGKIAAKVSYSLSDVILTVSDTAAEMISAKYSPKAPVYGIPVGVDPNRFQKKPRELARNGLIRKGLLPASLNSSFIILYTGIISSAQKVTNLAYLAEYLKGETSIALLVVGDGEDKQKLVDLKLQKELHNFYLLPWQPREFVPDIISAADLCAVLLAPEPIYEIAIPTKFYEYLACGKPILGICKGEIAKIIKSNGIGLSVDPCEVEKIALEIKTLAKSPDQIRKMESNCTLALEKFSLDAISDLFRAVLKNEHGLVT